MENVLIAGKNVTLRPLEKNELRGLFADALINYSFYDAKFLDNIFLLLIPKKGRKLSPLQYQKLADSISRIKGMPCVFLFENLATYERNRLIARGVHFIVSGKYVFLPFLLINAKDSTEVKTDALLPVAQYVLLFHLQKYSLEDYTLAKLEEILPYKYVTLSRAIRQLEAMNLCQCEIREDKQKHLHFNKTKKEMWTKTSIYMQSPIKSIYYTDIFSTNGGICGINALAAYSHLNSEEQLSYAISEESFKKMKAQGELYNLNQLEGDIKLEIWKYPPISCTKHPLIVDKLSLYLTLKEDPDPRVEKELEQMMNELW